MASIDNVLTGQQITTSDKNALEIVYSATGDFVVSALKYTLQGVPLTLYEDSANSNMHTLAVVSAGSSVVGQSAKEDFFFDGLYLQAIVSGNDNYLPVVVSDNTKNTSDTISKSGVTFAVNENNNLIFTKLNLVFDEDSEVVVGGMPLSIGRLGLNWYLKVWELL